ncbi:hypothetical protein Ahy_B08g091198 [Arachis hypogaea]|uniref:Uncharacterized protein n=1 Tax=Arachis hypogaea TaxID=3818 RepID=A0A444Y1Q1_ARAHY|nr:hypothetical protein Ahy_B08g091198 [Arachis hypogaea]
MENLTTSGNPMDDVGARNDPPVEGTAEHGDNQNGKFGALQNKCNHDNHGNGQTNPNFGPWMMVKRYTNKKKIQIRQKESHGNQKQVTKYNSEKDESPKRKDSDGSRFTVLHEEISEDVQGRIVEPRGNQVKQSDVLRVEVGSRDRKEESSSRDQVGPEQGALARKGAGSKAFPSIIRDLRQEYEANFFFLLETHVSGTRGKQIRDKMGFDKSFVVDAMAWITHPDFGKFVDASWNVKNSWDEGISNFKNKIKEWNSSVFGNVFKQKHRILRRLQGQWNVRKLQEMLPEDIVKRIVELVIHVLRDCFYARSIWQRLIPPNGINSFFNTSLNNWLSLNLTSNNNWSCLFGVAASSLWFFRNKLVFNGETVAATTVGYQIRARAEEFLKVVKSNLNPRNTRAASRCLVGWSRPDGDCVKLNVEGSWYAQRSNAACGECSGTRLGDS